MEEKLKEEIEQLRIKLLHVEARQAATSKSTPPVYIKSERKLPKLAGRPVKDSDPDVEDWVTDMRDHIVNTVFQQMMRKLSLYWTTSLEMLKRKSECVHPI